MTPEPSCSRSCLRSRRFTRQTNPSRASVGLKLLLLLFATTMSTCGKPSVHAPLQINVVDGEGALTSLSAAKVVGERPRFSPDGKSLVFQRGDKGSRGVFLLTLETSKVVELSDGKGDNLNPDFTGDGTRVLFASDRDGDFDVYWVASTGGAVTRVTDLPGDELEPAVSPLKYSFYAVYPDSCSYEGADGRLLDSYEKAAFSRRYDGKQEVWFTSLSGEHQGLISAEGEACRTPSWAGSGLSLVWACEVGDEAQPRLLDTVAVYDQSFAAALTTLSAPDGWVGEYEGDDAWGCQDWWDEETDWRSVECLKTLERRYSDYVGEANAIDKDLDQASYSANQTVLLTAAPQPGDTRLFTRERGEQVAGWAALETGAQSPSHPVWSPDGSRIAFDALSGSERIIVWAGTDFYLQEVRNLNDFPELYGAGTSERLQQNRFVARPGSEKEFFTAYEKLRYARRPQYITVDAALQLYRDEFLKLLRDAEFGAQGELAVISRALFDHYDARFKETHAAEDRFYAAYFVVPTVLLEAVDDVKVADAEDYLYARDPEYLDAEEKAELALATAPFLDKYLKSVPVHVDAMPEEYRAELSARVELILNHEGVDVIEIPSFKEPFKVDFSQFKVRGYYAEVGLAGYFLAMNWFGQVPLPLDASTKELVSTLAKRDASGEVLRERWSKVDVLIAAFMGRPVDATVSHFETLMRDQPGIVEPFDGKAVSEALKKLRGDVPLRGLEGATAEGGGGDYGLHFSLFPKRLGLDTTFFKPLTHPEVPLRGMPSSLDVMAALGVPAARTHALEREPEESYAASYEKALDELIGKSKGSLVGYASTDVYHSWLAALLAIATPLELSAESRLEFAQNAAFHDRQLFTALAGFAQLKHSAVLYAMQDMSAECDSSTPIQLLLEMPILPLPQGFVDPMPEVFRGLANLSGKVYQDLNGGEIPKVSKWDEEEGAAPLNAQTFATRLAEIAQDEVDGKPLSEAQVKWILSSAGLMEEIFLGQQESHSMMFAGGAERQERGIALVTDIHTAIDRGQVLELGIGRIMNLFVVVPSVVGQRMTQGGIFSFYEFEQDMSNRLSDVEWGERIERGEAPPLPAWSSSFVDGVTALPQTKDSARPVKKSGQETPPEEVETPDEGTGPSSDR